MPQIGIFSYLALFSFHDIFLSEGLNETIETIETIVFVCKGVFVEQALTEGGRRSGDDEENRYCSFICAVIVIVLYLYLRYQMAGWIPEIYSNVLMQNYILDLCGLGILLFGVFLILFGLFWVISSLMQSFFFQYSGKPKIFCLSIIYLYSAITFIFYLSCAAMTILSGDVSLFWFFMCLVEQMIIFCMIGFFAFLMYKMNLALIF
mgnify:CR=1 FL=1